MSMSKKSELEEFGCAAMILAAGVLVLAAGMAYAIFQWAIQGFPGLN